MARLPNGKKLHKWLKARGIGFHEAGRALGCTHVAVLQWCREERTPTPEYRHALHVWTGGEVDESEWPLSQREKARQKRVSRVEEFKANGTEDP